MQPIEYWENAHFIENHIRKHKVSFRGALILWKAKKALRRKVTLISANKKEKVFQR